MTDHQENPGIQSSPSKRRRGRPKTGRALTSTERMAKLRSRAREALGESGRELASQSDTALLELIREPLRQGQSMTLAEILVALMDRSNSRSAEPVELATLGVDGDWQQRTSLCTGLREAPTEPTPAKTRSWEYPAEIRARAVKMQANAATLDEIRQAIQVTIGRAPNSNLSRHLKKWAADPAVIEILGRE